MSIEIYYQNIRGMRTKLNEIRLQILSSNYDILCLTETWLNPSINSNEIFDSRYTVYRSDRNVNVHDKSDGGGVLLALRSSLFACKMNFVTDSHVIDSIFVKIRLNMTEYLVLGVVYFNIRIKFDDYKRFCDSLTDLVVSAPSNLKFLIIGDFNLSCIEWHLDTSSVIAAKCYEGRTADYLINTLGITGLSQHNLVMNHQNKLLDLALSNIPPKHIQITNSVHALSKIDPFHPPLQVDVRLNRLKFQSVNLLPSINFRHLRYSLIVKELQKIDWDILFVNKNINEMVEAFYNVLLAAVLNHSANKTKVKQNRFPTWFSSRLIALIIEKNKIRKRLRTYNNSCDRVLFSQFRIKVDFELKSCFQNHLYYLEEEIKSDPKKFWNYTNSLTNGTSFPSSMFLAQRSSSDGSVIANLFADNFRSVYSAGPSSVTLMKTDEFSELLCSESDVVNVINDLKINKGAGPDSIPNYFIKNLKDILCKPLIKIFNFSIKQSCFPDRWKQSYIIPIYKSGDQSDISNYRPISILNSFAKLFEKILHSKLFYLVRNIISHKQHGFYPHRSTITNLLEFTDFVFGSVDNNRQVDCIYTDFSKAFDKVNHSKLCSKLVSAGLSQSDIVFFQSYLIGRRQYVLFCGHKSQSFTPTSGVPQGSILGPLLFLIFINDLINVIETDCLLYADDLKIFKEVRNLSDSLMLQSDLHRVFQWCLINDLPLNINKCKTISFTRKLNKINFGYNVDGVLLYRDINVKDLGIIFDEKLKFDVHVDTICRKSFRILGFILRRGREFRSPAVFILLFNNLVRSTLEYGCQIWNPYYEVYSTKIELIQKKFTRFLCFKFVPFTSKLNYNIRLGAFDIESLGNRRLLLDEYLLFKIINNMIDSVINSKINFYAPAYFTRPSKLFYNSIPCTNLGFSSPCFRMQYNHDSIFKSIDLFCNSYLVFKRKCRVLLQ